MVLVMGPTTSSVQAKGTTPESGIQLYVGLKPTTEHSAAGSLIDPAVSEPSDPKTIPEEVAAAEPPEDPPGILEKSQGFLVGGLTAPYAYS